MIIAISVLLLINAVVFFTMALGSAADPALTWGMYAVVFVYFMGISQAGVLFSAILRMSQARWALNVSRFGEIVTLSFMPLSIIAFLVLYFGGVDDLFFWAHDDGSHGHISPWLGKDNFLIRFVLTQALFYVLAFAHFSAGRKEDGKYLTTGYMANRYNVISALVMITYVIAQTNIAWEFGMTFIPHWESTAFAPYFFVGNMVGGTALLFILFSRFVSFDAGLKAFKDDQDTMAKIILGFTLLWVYLFWANHIVIWYSDIPFKIKPFQNFMTGEWLPLFLFLIVSVFIFPFFALMQRAIKFSVPALTVVALSSCAGIFMARYLMIIPNLTEGGVPIFATWTGISLILGGLGGLLGSLSIFFKLFPQLMITEAIKRFPGDGEHL